MPNVLHYVLLLQIYFHFRTRIKNGHRLISYTLFFTFHLYGNAFIIIKQTDLHEIYIIYTMYSHCIKYINYLCTYEVFYFATLPFEVLFDSCENINLITALLKLHNATLIHCDIHRITSFIHFTVFVGDLIFCVILCLAYQQEYFSSCK